MAVKAYHSTQLALPSIAADISSTEVLPAIESASCPRSNVFRTITCDFPEGVLPMFSTLLLSNASIITEETLDDFHAS
jgi:hypothetical protein